MAHGTSCGRTRGKTRGRPRGKTPLTLTTTFDHHLRPRPHRRPHPRRHNRRRRGRPHPHPGELTPHAIESTYVSGVSSGGYLADQLHVAHSAVFEGTGIFSAGAYDCAQGSVRVSPLGKVACAATASPYVNTCGTDPERSMLSHLFGAPVNPATTAPLDGSLVRFDQNRHAPGGNAAAVSMGRDGFAYVPKACAGDPSRLMVALHGCRQTYGQIGDTHYADKAGKQITAIMSMVKRLGG
ncbi:hypothetical protein [Streptomyces venezuelae]